MGSERQTLCASDKCVGRKPHVQGREGCYHHDGIPVSESLSCFEAPMVSEAMRAAGASAYHAWRNDHDTGTGKGTRDMCGAIITAALRVRQEALGGEDVERVISAWAFAHNIDGAARNDLFARLRRHQQGG